MPDSGRLLGTESAAYIALMQISAHRFSFRHLVLSHGWVFLAPFSWSDATSSLTRPVNLPIGDQARIRIRVRRQGASSGVQVSIDSASCLTIENRQSIRHQVTRMLRLDEEFSPFWKLCLDDPNLRFAARMKIGGMLRGPHAFEDLVKTVCTTNCDWRNTKAMCHGLCSLNAGAFPTPQVILRHSLARLTRTAPLGYRARTVREAARLFAEGRMPLDNWAQDRDFGRIRAALLQIWGVGPYCADHMLVLLGCYGHIPVDSEVLRYLRNTHFGGKPVSQEKAVSPYEAYGDWRYLAFKFSRMARKMNYINK